MSDIRRILWTVNLDLKTFQFRNKKQKHNVVTQIFF